MVVFGGATFDEVINHRPTYADAYREVRAALDEQDVVDPRILELCRLRIAQLLGAGSELPSGTLTEQQQVCLGYAEQLLLDAQGVTDDQAKAVIEAVGEGGFLVLTYACGFFETTQRAELLLAVGSQR